VRVFGGEPGLERAVVGGDIRMGAEVVAEK
jgi:hypothetical protein